MTILVQQQLSKEQVREKIINSMCLTMRHDFGLNKPDGDDIAAKLSSGMTDFERGSLRRDMQSLFDHHISSLLDEIDRLEGAQHGARSEVHGLSAQHGRDSAELRRLCQARDDARKERDRLKAENADLRRDAERYRWLRDRTGYRLFGYLTCQPASIVDAEIDQAMTKGQQP